MSAPKTVEQYLSSIEPEQKVVLEKMRKQIRSLVPSATESISYGMPLFKYNGKYLIAIGAFKNHMSVFPGSGAIAKLTEELKDFTVSKGTVQFTPQSSLTASLLSEIVLARVAEIESSNQKE